MSKTVHSNSELPSSWTTSRSSEVLLQKEAARKERNPKHYALAKRVSFPDNLKGDKTVSH